VYQIRPHRRQNERAGALVEHDMAKVVVEKPRQSDFSRRATRPIRLAAARRRAIEYVMSAKHSLSAIHAGQLSLSTGFSNGANPMKRDLLILLAAGTLGLAAIVGCTGQSGPVDSGTGDDAYISSGSGGEGAGTTGTSGDAPAESTSPGTSASDDGQ
jgi:hypothetical protein